MMTTDIGFPSFHAIMDDGRVLLPFVGQISDPAGCCMAGLPHATCHSAGSPPGADAPASP